MYRNYKKIQINKIMKYKYIISPVTIYNEDEQLYETKVGLNSKDMPLHYIVCGKSESISRERAQQLAELLNDITIHQVI